MTPPTVVEVVRAAAGAADLLLPARVGRTEAGSGSAFPAGVLRVLGARQLVQAAVLRDAPGAGHRLGAVVDGLHALTMAATAAVSARYRRAAVTQLLVAAGFCLTESVLSPSTR